MKWFVCSVAAVAACAAASAQAGTVRIDNGQAVKTITFNNADLADTQRAAKVYAKLETVAAEVCQVDGDAPQWVLNEDRDCMDRAISGAVRDLASPVLSEVHANANQGAAAYARHD